jgi:hypothetical protein
MFRSVSCLLFSIVVCCSVLPGCGSGLKTARVSGVITLDGEPLQNASVTFTPPAAGGEAPISNGRTDAQGRYSLTVTATNDVGAVVGTHRVNVALIGDSSEEDDSGLIAEEASLPAHDFTFEVTPGGSEAASFDLKSE